MAGRIRRPPTLEDDLDDLFAAAPAAVRSWMLRKVRTADDVRPGLPYASPQLVQRVVGTWRSERWGPWVVPGARGHRRDAWGIAEAALLRHLCGLTHERIAARLGLTTSLVGRRLRSHRALASDRAYADRWEALATTCLRAAGEGVEMGV